MDNANEEIVNMVNDKGETPIFTAIFRNPECQSFTVVEKLLAAGANINHMDKSGKTILHHTIARGDFGNFKFLCEHNADLNIIDESNKELPIFSCLKKPPIFLKYLLETVGLDVNTKNNEGFTLLQKASMENLYDAVEVLLDHDGIKIDEKTPDGQANAFILAVERCNMETIDKFYKKDERKYLY